MLLKKISLGLAQTDKNYGYGSDKRDQIHEIIKFASKNNIHKIDTSPNYKGSDLVLSKINISNYKISSKILSATQTINNLDKFIDKQISNILNSNKIKKIENLFLHDPLFILDEKLRNKVLKKINLLKKNDIIKNFGVSIYNKYELSNILKYFSPDIIQFPYNVFNQTFNDKNYLLSLKKRGIKLQARSIFMQGLLCEKNLENKFNIWKEDFLKWKNFLKIYKIKSNIACADFAFKNNLIDEFVFGFRNLNELTEIINFAKNYKDKKINYSKLENNDQYLIDPRLWCNLKNKNFIQKYKEYKNNKKKILFGGMLLSKRVDQFIPGKWPNFFEKANGCKIKYKNNTFLDFSLMGVGTNILGYANKKVNYSVIKTIKKSNISTINSEYHSKLSSQLLEMDSWASKCFFAKTGAEANSIALRIARCHNKKNGVAICGYHGWHDWYLSANIKKKNNLNHIHLKNLETLGIPKELKNLVHPFFYNNINSLKKIIKKNKNIGTIFMEAQRNQLPENNFLKKIRRIADQNNIVLIFDECSSGFRETYGGIYKKYDINPDIVVYGKAIANGYPLTVILGKEEIFKSAINSFISSTFWTDNIGAIAAIKTLEEMKNKKTWIKITRIGKRIKSFWLKCSKKYKLNLNISGIDAMPSFNFDSDKNEYYKTFIIQEMLKKNILSSNIVYCCIQHEKYIEKYFKELEKIFKKIGEFQKGLSIQLFLNSPVTRKDFGRLN